MIFLAILEFTLICIILLKDMGMGRRLSKNLCFELL